METDDRLLTGYKPSMIGYGKKPSFTTLVYTDTADSVKQDLLYFSNSLNTIQNSIQLLQQTEDSNLVTQISIHMDGR